MNKKKDNKYFQYSITVVLNHQNIENHPEIKSNIKPFIEQHNWEGIDFPNGIKDLNEIITKLILISCLCRKKIKINKKEKNLAYKSKYNRKRENEVVLLMITNGKQIDEVDKWHYIALKSVGTDDGSNHQ